MHFVTYVACLVDFSDFTGFLNGTQGNDGFNQFYRSMTSGHGSTDAGQVFQLHHRIVTIGRKKMDFPALRDGFSDEIFQLVGREAFANPYLGCQFFDAGLRSHPDNVIHIYIIAEEIIFSVVGVNDSRISGVRLTEEIDERTVLTILVCVIGVIGRSFVVT